MRLAYKANFKAKNGYRLNRNRDNGAGDEFSILSHADL